MIEHIDYNNKKIAIIIYSNYNSNGLEFFTPDNYPQQIAYMRHPKGKLIQPHIHLEVKREIYTTIETLYIKSGVVEALLFDENKVLFNKKILKAGDIIFLCGGGHGFNIIEEAEIIEIKQGPYMGVNDKIKFNL